MSSLSASTLFSVPGLVAVITGGGSGLGLMAAKALDANGAKRVYILGRRQSALEQAASQAVNGSIRPIVADVTSKTDLQRAVDIVSEEIGYVNFVFANSGTSGIDDFRKVNKASGLSGLREVLWQSDPDDFTKTMHVNIAGAYYTAIAFLDLLDRGNLTGLSSGITQKSQILITTSAGSFTRVPIAGLDYSASKAGALHMAKVMQTALAPYKIRVNCIAPGLYPSEMSANNPNMQVSTKTSSTATSPKPSTTSQSDDPTIEGNIESSRVPLARAGNEKDFAGAILYLASEAGGFVNGEFFQDFITK